MDDITENFATECLINVQNLFRINMQKKSAGWMDKFTKKILMDYSVSTQKQSLSKVSACCRCSLPS